MDSFSIGKFSSIHEFRGGVKIDVSDLDHVPIFYDQPVWYRLIDGDCCLDVYALIKRDPRILVLGQDALLEGRTELPYFYRSKWHSLFDCSLITLNDPTLYDKRGWTCGWWQKPGALSLSHKFIRSLADSCKVPDSNIVFYGASAGGYYAIASAHEFNESVLVADIPQIDLETSPFAEKAKMVSSVYGELKSVFDWWGADSSKVIRQIVYLQNSRDYKHTRTQLPAFLSGVASYVGGGEAKIKDLSIKFYENMDQSRGHSPMSTENLVPFLNGILNGFVGV